MYKSPPSVLILRQINTIHDPPPTQFLKLHLNIILSSTPWSSMWSFSLRFADESPVRTSPFPHTCHMTRPSHFSRCDNRIILGEEYRSLSSSLCSFLQSLLPLRPKYSPKHPILKHLQPTFLSLNVSDQVSHPYKTTGKIIECDETRRIFLLTNKFPFFWGT